MNKGELAQRLARQMHRSRAQAADELDALVYRLLKDLKRPPGALRKERVKVVAATTLKDTP